MNATTSQQNIFQAILEERARQDKKFGADRMLDDGEWLKIIIEEIGEVAKASLENSPEELRREMIQVAAVAFAWLECIYRRSYLNVEVRDE